MMGLITKEVEVTLVPANIKHYENLGYGIPRRKDKKGRMTLPRGSKIIVKIKDLLKGSDALIDVDCDCCGKKLKNMKWKNYIKFVNKEKYYCQKCAVNFARNKIKKIKLSKSKSFEQWCVENNRQDILNRWNYDLNDCKPSEVSYRSGLNYYFKCPRYLHDSELRSLTNIVRDKKVNCSKCNSFAQWGIDHLGKDFLEKYWDYKKNTVNPWNIGKKSSKSIHIFCQEKDYHGSYKTQCNNFTKGIGCSYCSNRKVHPLDSLGKLLESKNLLNIWSNKNKKSPYEYAPHGSEHVWWKCPEGKHKDFKRAIYSSYDLNFRCPKCQSSKGEEILDEILIQFNCPHGSQYSFNNLKGIRGKKLRFDIPVFWDEGKTKLRMLIEYDGEQHFRPICFGGISKERAIENFKQIRINDIKKNLYCAKYGIQLIRIPYWEYDNIDKILKYYLDNDFDY